MYSINAMATLFLVFSSRWRMKIVWKALDIFKKIIIIFQIDFIYCRVELERKLWNQIVYFTDDIKPLVSTLLCQGTNQFFITQAENDNYVKEKEKSEAVIIHLRFSRESDLRRRYLKEKNEVPLSMQWRDYGIALQALMDVENIFILLTFCSFFLWKMLLARAQYLLSSAKIDKGSLTEINFDSTRKKILRLYNVIVLNVTYR